MQSAANAIYGYVARVTGGVLPTCEPVGQPGDRLFALEFTDRALKQLRSLDDVAPEPSSLLSHILSVGKCLPTLA
jgi:hypothetical protein